MDCELRSAFATSQENKPPRKQNVEEIYAVLRHKKISHSTKEVTEKMACLIGVEPTAFRLGGGPSILLRYRQIFDILARFDSRCKMLCNKKTFCVVIITQWLPKINFWTPFGWFCKNEWDFGTRYARDMGGGRHAKFRGTSPNGSFHYTNFGTQSVLVFISVSMYAQAQVEPTMVFRWRSYQFKKLGRGTLPFFIYVYARSCVAKYAHIYKNASAFALA